METNNKAFRLEIWESFKSDYEWFFREKYPDLFTQEIRKLHNLRPVQLVGLDRMELVDCDISYRKTPYDVLFLLHIYYKECYEWSTSKEGIQKLDLPLDQKRVYSQYFKTVVRDKLDAPYHVVQQSLHGKCINTIILREYSGGLSKAEFSEKMKEKGIDAIFIG